MKKRIVALFCALVMLLSVSSCSIWLKATDDIPDLKNDVKYLPGEGDMAYVRYQDVIYRRDATMLFCQPTDSKLQENGNPQVGWERYGFTGRNIYYANTSEAPMIIYAPAKKEMYLREEYDYMSDVFVIDDTDVEVVFSNMFEDFSVCFRGTPIDYAEVKLYSKTCSDIQIVARVFSHNGKNRISPLHSPYYWTASDEFITLLTENDLLGKE